MNKHNQNLSLSISEETKRNIKNILESDKNIQNYTNEADRSTKFTSTKRERILPKEEIKNMNEIKKQRLEESLTSLLNNSNLTNNNQNSMINLISSNNFNQNMNINNFMGGLNTFPTQNIYQGGMNPYMTNVNPNFNIYQNIAGAKLSKVAIPNQYSSNLYASQNANKIIGNNNSYNMYGNRNLTNPNFIGLNTNTFYNNPLDLPITQKVTEKKKYVIQDMPEMTVGNYLHNQNTKETYMNTINNKVKVEEHQIPLGNNIVLQTKTVAPQVKVNINNTAVQTNMIKTGTGNVITFNNINPTSNLCQNKTEVKSKFSNSNTEFIPVSGNNQNSNSNAASTKKSNSFFDTFSDSLKRYIERSYTRCKSDDDRINNKNGLMKILQEATLKKEISTRNWDSFPLPKITQDILLNKPKISDKEIDNREKRKGRFDAEYNNFISTNKETTPPPMIEETTKNVVIGTCQTLEKQYLRLTSVPDPSQVRPEKVLEKSLKMLKDKWKNKKTDYNYINEQFRSIRQDMTIQHIKNKFTVRVYETHARIALESLDLDQFNQCQTALISLYSLGIQGSDIEFLAYRIIYTILQEIKYDMEDLLRDVYSKEKSSGIISKNPEIAHALKVVKAINLNNYYEFFKLYKTAPNMGGYLIEPFLPRLRIVALQVCAAGYFTEANVDSLWDKLAFDSVDSFIKFLEENSIILSNDRKKVNFKESLAALSSSKLLAAKQFKVSNIY